ncbi:16S rRNA (cytidine(1402)-2'-O)-methyltransferase [Actinomyces minihominis]|uniref:16S rRNA (cytidine(1402)-2'-O)-methyltransferase n=1 Tax=Actinomyces minihominis TaxID=2002838 RepID=UPI000C085E28|nr:16S rRNA (cytidine(1402)-2'-O)-methyltransferase [Actinomyces minihominis]
MSEQAPGIIYMAATPIGNVDDASLRLRELLASADIIAAEDTRRLRNLCARMEVALTGTILAFHEHVEDERAADLIEAAQKGQTVLVVSDAGTPTVSDPGYRLSVKAAEAGVRLAPLPGPSAALAALSVSGLPSDRFVFEGFLPRKHSELKSHLAELADEPRTFILFESPRRTAETLRALRDALGGDRRAALCRELTKTYEEVTRGTLTELVVHTEAEPVLGEVTLVIEGAPKRATTSIEELAQQALALAEREGIRLKEAAATVAEDSGHRPNAVFKEALGAG